MTASLSSIFPRPSASDPDDVVWTLQTAAVQWQRDMRADAIVWVRRAADSAAGAGDRTRAVQLQAEAARLSELLWSDPPGASGAASGAGAPAGPIVEGQAAPAGLGGGPAGQVASGATQGYSAESAARDTEVVELDDDGIDVESIEIEPIELGEGDFEEIEAGAESVDAAPFFEEPTADHQFPPGPGPAPLGDSLELDAIAAGRVVRGAQPPERPSRASIVSSAGQVPKPPALPRQLRAGGVVALDSAPRPPVGSDPAGAPRGQAAWDPAWDLAGGAETRPAAAPSEGEEARPARPRSAPPPSFMSSPPPSGEVTEPPGAPPPGEGAAPVAPHSAEPSELVQGSYEEAVELQDFTIEPEEVTDLQELPVEPHPASEWLTEPAPLAVAAETHEVTEVTPIPYEESLPGDVTAPQTAELEPVDGPREFTASGAPAGPSPTPVWAHPELSPGSDGSLPNNDLEGFEAAFDAALVEAPADEPGQEPAAAASVEGAFEASADSSQPGAGLIDDEAAESKQQTALTVPAEAGLGEAGPGEASSLEASSLEASSLDAGPTENHSPEVPLDTQVPPALAGCRFEDLEAFADLPEAAQRRLAAAAEVIQLDENASRQLDCGVAALLEGSVRVVAAVGAPGGASAAAGSVLSASSAMVEAAPLQLTAQAPGAQLALWPSEALVEPLSEAPWVQDELLQASDRLRAVAGAVAGEIGQRLDQALLAPLLARFDFQALAPRERLLEAATAVPGLFLVGAGELQGCQPGAEVFERQWAPGQFVLGESVFAGLPAALEVRAGQHGALLLRAPRPVAHELMMSFPPLIEMLAG